MSVDIRTATIEDANDILKIYAYYITNTAITFEYDVPTIEEFVGRIDNTLKNYPYLVAIIDNQIVGYAYVGPLKKRAAYARSVELSIYIDRNLRGQGVGGKLFEMLVGQLKQRGILNLYSCVSYAAAEDEYLTHDSVAFHEYLGFKIVGHYHKCGYKFNRWYDVVWMEKMIGEHV